MDTERTAGPGRTPARTTAAGQEQLTFAGALMKALEAKRVRRLGWPDDGTCLYFSIQGDTPPATGGILRAPRAAETPKDVDLS